MKVAVSSTGRELDSQVDPRFGRADYLVIVETDTGSIVEVIDNTSAREAAHGAGINAASRIAEAGARAILTGRVGPKAAAVCEKAGITMVDGVSGTVQQAVSSYSPEKGVGPEAREPRQTQADQTGFGRGQGMGMGGGRRGAGGGRGGGGCRRQGALRR